MPVALDLRRLLAVLVAVLCCACSSGGGGGVGTGGSALTVTPGAVGFSVVQNAMAPPASQYCRLTVSAPDAYYVAAGYPLGTTKPTWLAMWLSGSGQSSTLDLVPNTTALAAGTYTTAVRVAVARQDQSITSVDT